jgi:hypothetical protein
MTKTISIVLALIAAPVVARAQDPAAPAPMPDPAVAAAPAAAAASNPLAKENWPTKVVDRPIALSAGMLEIDLPIVSNLGKSSVGKPVNVPLVLFYGVTDEFQLSLHHGLGLCLTGKSNGCGKAYNDLGLRGTYSLMGRGSSFELAAWAQLNFVAFSPDMVMQAVIGPYVNWVLGGGKAVILTNPGVAIGLNKRDAGNKEALAFPLYAFFQANDNIAPYLFTGIFSPFSGFGDKYAVPAGLGIFYGLNQKVDLALEFDFTNLGGKMAPGQKRTDGRQIFVQVNFRPL